MTWTGRPLTPPLALMSSAAIAAALIKAARRTMLWPAIWLLKYQAWLHPRAELEPHLLVQRTVFVADQNIFETMRVGDEQLRIAGVVGNVEHQVGEVSLSRPQRRREG